MGKRRRVKYDGTSGGREEGLNMEGGPWGGQGLHMEGQRGRRRGIKYGEMTGLTGRPLTPWQLPPERVL